jgi:hypothetical protein
MKKDFSFQEKIEAFLKVPELRYYLVHDCIGQLSWIIDKKEKLAFKKFWNLETHGEKTFFGYKIADVTLEELNHIYLSIAKGESEDINEKM